MSKKWKHAVERYAGPVICIIGSVLFVALGIIKLINIASFKPVTATIVRIEEDTSAVDEDGVPEYTYTAYARYEVGGQIYEEQLDGFENSYEQGNEIKILYNPEDPSDITVPKRSIGYILIAFGALLFIAGGFSIYMSITRRNEKR